MSLFVDRSISRVRAYFLHVGLGKKGFAELAGVADTTLRDITDEKWSPSVRTLRRLEEVVPNDFEIGSVT